MRCHSCIEHPCLNMLLTCLLSRAGTPLGTWQQLLGPCTTNSSMPSSRSSSPQAGGLVRVGPGAAAPEEEVVVGPASTRPSSSSHQAGTLGQVTALVPFSSKAGQGSTQGGYRAGRHPSQAVGSHLHGPSRGNLVTWATTTGVCQG
jgi:hypothetical protein